MLSFPLYMSANPSRAGHSAIVRLPIGVWVVEGDNVDSEIHVLLSDDPLTILTAENKLQTPCTVNLESVMFIVATIEKRGTEKYINLNVRKLNVSNA